MKVNCDADTLTVGGIKELDATSLRCFQNAVSTAWTDGLKHIEIDLSEAVFVDSCGLGALASLRKLVVDRQGRVRLVNPSPSTQQLLELTRLYRLLDIVKRQGVVDRDEKADSRRLAEHQQPHAH